MFVTWVAIERNSKDNQAFHVHQMLVLLSSNRTQHSSTQPFKVHRHEGLQVAHLASHLAGEEATVGEHLEAVKAVLETRPEWV